MGIMSLQLIPWNPGTLGEPPPVRFDWPLHVGELHCRICVPWPRHGQGAE